MNMDKDYPFVPRKGPLGDRADMAIVVKAYLLADTLVRRRPPLNTCRWVDKT